jgi:acyl-CoA synthetase (AMP-forming)/AMP-acid ligase II
MSHDQTLSGGLTAVMYTPILLNSQWPPDEDALVTLSTRATWGDLRERLDHRRADAAPLAEMARRRVGVLFQPTPLCLEVLAHLERLACDVFLLDAQLSDPDAQRLASEWKLAAVLCERADGTSFDLAHLSGEEPGSGDSSLTILTSGTTGKAKAARHTWATLCRPIRTAGARQRQRWLLTYRPHLYAGLQVLLQCLANGGTLLVPGPQATPAAVAELMSRERAEYASATPSYWRRLLLFAPADVLRQAPLRQLTLGGEVVDQPILDALRRTFPQARLVHIYATTELGRCFSVSDGQAGFPTRYLDQPSADGVQLTIDQGELLVRSANAMRSYDPLGPVPQPAREWFRTGDLVEVRGERVHFVGRRSDMINVGGNKVHPIEVERVLRGVPGVLDVRVYPRRSSIAGELVACEVVAEPGADLQALRQELQARSLAELTAYQRPRLLDFVEELALGGSGKTIRKPSNPAREGEPCPVTS